MRAAGVIFSLFLLVMISFAAFPEQASVQIIAPETGTTAQVGDNLQILIVTQPDLDVTTIAVMVDTLGLGMIQTAPYVLTWNTAGITPGNHILRAFAYLKSGEKVGAEPIIVTLRAASSPSFSETEPQQINVTEPVTLKEGTPVLLTTTEKLISGRIPEGSTIRYKVARDVVGSGNNIVIAYGSFAQGKITRSRRRGMFGKAGQLEFTVDTAEAVDGTPIPLRAMQEASGKGNKNEVIVSALLLTVLAVFVHGRDIEIPEGTEITAYVDHDTVIAQPQPLSAEGIIRGAPLEEISIRKPSNGSSFSRGSQVMIGLEVTPLEKFRSVKIFADNVEILSHEGELKELGWYTHRVPSKEYTLTAEVRFINGRVVRSAPVKVTITGG